MGFHSGSVIHVSSEQREAFILGLLSMRRDDCRDAREAGKGKYNGHLMGKSYAGLYLRMK